MQSFSEFHASLERLTSDIEVAVSLKEYFSRIAVVVDVNRFVIFERQGKRCFLVRFSNPIDAAKITSQYKLRSFAFNGGLIELDMSQSNANAYVGGDHKI